MLQSTKDRNNFQGIQFTSNYAYGFPPYCYVNEKNEILGRYPDILRIAAQHLNLSLTFQAAKPENKGYWTSMTENGTHIGYMAEVSNGQVDTSVAGFSLLLERYKLADFSQAQ